MCADLKGAPTDFSGLLEHLERASEPQIPRKLIRRYRGPSALDIDDRYAFVRRLGGGREGAVNLYEDSNTGDLVAIKRFQSVYRNPLPPSLLKALEVEKVYYWPAEIQATILLGGSSQRTHEAGLISERGLESSDCDMLPALDYFLIREGSWSSTSFTWHLVTPFLGKGTLTHLAQNLEASNQTSCNLDHAFRPSLHRLVESLARLHKLSVCHNDVKPDNIYILDQQHWLLGDLGNVREINHPYYSTPKWQREGQWADCQTNDIRRALISYMNLIRRAAADKEVFDQQIICRSSALAEFYWGFMEEPVSADELLQRLETVWGHGNASVKRKSVKDNSATCDQPDSGWWLLRSPSISQRVDLELRWSIIPGKWMMFWIRSWRS
ncbi:MAG: hypothetical protein Q9168_008389 [Polycauliona sp. 1 TL-2023]